MPARTRYKPDFYYNAFIQRQREAIHKFRTSDPHIIADAVGMTLDAYIRDCEEIAELLKR